MMLKASGVVIALAIGVSAGAAAHAETGCPTAHKTARHPARQTAARTIIVEEHYVHAPRRPAYAEEPSAPPEAYAPPPAEVAYGAPGDYYGPILTSYGYGGYGYGYGFGGRTRWGGPFAGRGAPGFVHVRPGVVHVGPSVVRPSGFGGGARVAMGGRGGVMIGGFGRGR